MKVSLVFLVLGVYGCCNQQKSTTETKKFSGRLIEFLRIFEFNKSDKYEEDCQDDCDECDECAECDECDECESETSVAPTLATTVRSSVYSSSVAPTLATTSTRCHNNTVYSSVAPTLATTSTRCHNNTVYSSVAPTLATTSTGCHNNTASLAPTLASTTVRSTTVRSTTTSTTVCDPADSYYKKHANPNCPCKKACKKKCSVAPTAVSTGTITPTVTVAPSSTKVVHVSSHTVVATVVPQKSLESVSPIAISSSSVNGPIGIIMAALIFLIL